jgi:glycine cleavage system aminomethyltransferase T
MLAGRPAHNAQQEGAELSPDNDRIRNKINCVAKRGERTSSGRSRTGARIQWAAAGSVAGLGYVPGVGALLGYARVSTAEQNAAAEAHVTRNSVAMYDLTARKHLEVEGPGALNMLQGLTSNDVAKGIGAVTYTLVLDEAGGVVSDLTVARLRNELFQVIANGPLDVDRLAGHAPSGVSVRDVTGGCCIGLWGPKAGKVLQPLTRTDDSHEALRSFWAQLLSVAGLPVTALRVSNVGEPGWELYTSADHGLNLWVRSVGRRAGTRGRRRRPQRVQQPAPGEGLPALGIDVTAEHDPYEAGLGFAVCMDKDDFVGRAAVDGRSADTVTRRLTCWCSTIRPRSSSARSRFSWTGFRRATSPAPSTATPAATRSPTRGCWSRHPVLQWESTTSVPGYPRPSAWSRWSTRPCPASAARRSHVV